MKLHMLRATVCCGMALEALARMRDESDHGGLEQAQAHLHLAAGELRLAAADLRLVPPDRPEEVPSV